MSDSRFARLKTDPRFRKPRRKINKVIVDDRFKSLFHDGAQENKSNPRHVKVDKYGRKVPARQDTDNLRRFYRLEEEGALGEGRLAPDYARGEALMESSDEDDEQAHDTEDDGGEVVLGRDIRKPIIVPKDEVEVDLDESQFAELDAQAAANLAKETDTPLAGQGERTNRLALVNLDWDHVRAPHLFKIFSSVISPTSVDRGGSPRVTKGKVICVRVYPSEFGKKRMAQEEKEGPPKELFKKREHKEEDDGEQALIEEDDGNEYDEESLRNYQLERLRYYYAIITCDSVDAASHIYSELDGTELERSANMLDLSFVPNDMTFEDDFRDEATHELSEEFKGVEFVTDALRHSRVKLTWDDDDPERNKVTRRTFTRKEIEQSDFKAYLASSSSEDERSDIEDPVSDRRDKMRALLLGGTDEGNEHLPEGWGRGVDKSKEMEITFTPGLSGTKDDVDGEDETTLQQYLRKQKERRKKKKSGKKGKDQSEELEAEQDEFFGEDSDQDKETFDPQRRIRPKHAASTAELELLLTPDRLEEPKHFDMRAVVKAEKSKKKGRKNTPKPKDGRLDEDETQEYFTIDVKDDRFKALHDDHNFAIDPSNPHFKKTKSMGALLEERARRQRKGIVPEKSQREIVGEQSLKSLVESVKRKSALASEHRSKRPKLSP